ncbi:MAG: D-2-hydroxyacid dehydrogenase [Bacteroidales bacterium]|nr:D-2-hydroxyacid dehydrogenase [Bacteroidales bacterium]
MRIIFLDAATLGATSLEPIAQLGELVTWPTSTPEEALDRVRDAEILIVNKVKVTEALMDAAPKLRLICEAATGVNNIDVAAAERRGIPVRNVAGYSTESVVQVTFTLLLSLVCKPERYDAEVKDLTYSRSGLFTDVKTPFAELAGKTIGIVGMGTIGSRVATVAAAFGMRVIYYSTSGTSHCREYPSVPLETLLKESDVISIHAPLNERTNGLIRAAELRQMKPTAVIINIGRGGIVNEADLAEAVSEEVIAGAGLDVYTTEPLPADHPLLHTKHPERLRFTPHIGWTSAEALVRLVEGIAANIRKPF